MKKQTLNWKHLVTASTLVTFTAACAPQGFRAVESSLSNEKVSDTDEVRVACVPDATDFNLRLNAYAFEMTDSQGINFGFNIASGLLKAIGLGVNVQSGTLSLSMDMEDPLKSSSIPILGGAKLTKSNFNFNIDVGVIAVGANTAATTSLTKLSQAGIQDVLKKAAVAASQYDATWSTKVSGVDDETHFTIPVGTLAGLRRGDEFYVYDYKYFWKGAPCASQLDHAYKPSATPLAKAVVWDLDLDSATLMVEGKSLGSIQPGALVEVANLQKLSKKEARSLKRSVRISAITQSGQLVITGVGAVDITAYIRAQMPALMTNQPFWIR